MPLVRSERSVGTVREATMVRMDLTGLRAAPLMVGTDAHPGDQLTHLRLPKHRPCHRQPRGTARVGQTARPWSVVLATRTQYILELPGTPKLPA